MSGKKIKVIISLGFATLATVVLASGALLQLPPGWARLLISFPFIVVDLPAVIFGGLVSGSAHGPNELVYFATAFLASFGLAYGVITAGEYLLRYIRRRRGSAGASH